MTTEPAQSASTQRGGIPADSFANRLMLARAYAGHIPIRRAAELCGFGHGAWTNWEKGANPADKVEVAEVISEKLGVDFDWLLFGGSLSSKDQEGRPLRRRDRRGREGINRHFRSPDDRPDDRNRTEDSRRPRVIFDGPAGQGRTDSRRPVSAVPASTRRPRDGRPRNRTARAA